MWTVSTVIFFINRDLYGVETQVVKEIIMVPEFFWNPELPSTIAGVFSYRSNPIAVFNLHQWFGGVPRKLRTSDQVIIVDWEGHVAGLIVDKVQDVATFAMETVDGGSSVPTSQGSQNPGIVAIRNIHGQSVKMLDLSLVLQYVSSLHTSEKVLSLASYGLAMRAKGQSDRWVPVSSKGFENLTKETLQLLQDRADAVALSEPAWDAQQWITLTVVRLNEEYLGLDPLVVREFSELLDLVPIPGCPNFVLGHMNLRGEVLTVFDLRYVLNMPIQEDSPLSQVAVIEIETCLMGIAVQEVLDCIPCESNDSPSARDRGEQGSYTKDVSQYRGETLKFLDISRLIASKVLEVYEEV